MDLWEIRKTITVHPLDVRVNLNSIAEYLSKDGKIVNAQLLTQSSRHRLSCNSLAVNCEVCNTATPGW